jgi:hypothetical protein
MHNMNQPAERRNSTNHCVAIKGRLRSSKSFKIRIIILNDRFINQIDSQSKRLTYRISLLYSVAVSHQHDV